MLMLLSCCCGLPEIFCLSMDT